MLASCLLIVTLIAEVSVAPAEPLGEVATESALPLDVCGSMLLAILVSKVKALCRAASTEMVFWFEVFCSYILLAPCEVWLLTPTT